MQCLIFKWALLISGINLARREALLSAGRLATLNLYLKGEGHVVVGAREFSRRRYFLRRLWVHHRIALITRPLGASALSRDPDFWSVPPRNPPTGRMRTRRLGGRRRSSPKTFLQMSRRRLCQALGSWLLAHRSERGPRVLDENEVAAYVWLDIERFLRHTLLFS